MIGAGYLVAGTATLAAVGGLWWQTSRVEALQQERASLRASVAALEASAEQAREAYRVADAHRRREAARVEQLSATIEALIEGDFTNANIPVDPGIADLLDCLRLHPGDPAACADNPH